MKNRHRAQGSRVAGLPLAALALSLAVMVEARAQDSGAPTPAPSTSRPIDFRLPPAEDGRSTGVQGPSDNGLPPLAPGERRGVPTPTPQPAPPRVAPTLPAPSTVTPAPAPARRDAPPSAAPAARTTPVPAVPAPDSTASPPSPASGSADIAPTGSDSSPATITPSTAPAPDDARPVPAPATGEGETPVWAWLLAALAAIGAGGWYWRRRAATAGALPADEVEPPIAEAPRPVPRTAVPVKPRPATPAPSDPISPAPAPPRPATPFVTVPAAPSPLVTRPAGEQRAQVSMNLEIRAIRFKAEAVAVSFTLNLTNEGAIAATGLMVRIAMGQGSAMPEAVLARFFDGAGGSVLRDDIMLAPGASEQLSTDVMLPRAAIEPLMIGGKPMLVPVLAFDVTYHWDGTGDAFGQAAGSFVLGRAPAPGVGDRLAPLPLDRPTHAVDRPGARATAIRRYQ